jgi:2-dehydro-3-deoxygalactonokinase
MIGVDWGTSSFRAFRLDDAGAVRDRTESAMGITRVPPGGFAATLAEAIAPWVASGETRVLLSGMVGSRQGWVEAPYLPCPAGAAEIAAALVDVPFAGARVKLVPGLSDADQTGTPEVMRGEETQIVGVLDRLLADEEQREGAAAREAPLAQEAWACLPGSHSKWARIRDRRIVAYRTYLSGEAFAALRGGTILGRMMADAPHDPLAFARGLARAAEPGHLLHHLFGVRTLGLMGRLAETESASYLSGLLIGHEVGAALPAGALVHLIGAPALCALYADAVLAFGGRAAIMDADAAARGLAAIGRAADWS